MEDDGVCAYEGFEAGFFDEGFGDAEGFDGDAEFAEVFEGG